MGFSHPDTTAQGLNPLGLDDGEYYDTVRKALDEFEIESGLAVEVAAHPRAQPGSLDPFYGGRRVLYGQGAEAIAQSDVVLLMNATTAVGLCVAFNRPMIVLQSSKFLKNTVQKTTRLATILSLPIVDLDRAPHDWSIPEISAKAYATYLHQYVKRPGTPESLFWEVVATTIENRLCRSAGSGRWPE
jgi:hypothetical protein